MINYSKIDKDKLCEYLTYIFDGYYIDNFRSVKNIKDTAYSYFAVSIKDGGNLGFYYTNELIFDNITPNFRLFNKFVKECQYYIDLFLEEKYNIKRIYF